MSKIRSKDSKIELLVRNKLSKQGIKYRKNVKRLEGNPDIAFIGKKVVVFLDSCFWHGCYYHFRMPSANREYWEQKIKGNRERDKFINRYYKQKDWVVLRFWEHQISTDLNKVIDKISNTINSL